MTGEHVLGEVMAIDDVFHEFKGLCAHNLFMEARK